MTVCFGVDIFFYIENKQSYNYLKNMRSFCATLYNNKHNIVLLCLTDTSLYIYICVKHFGVANIKKIPTKYFCCPCFFLVFKESPFRNRRIFIYLAYSCPVYLSADVGVAYLRDSSKGEFFKREHNFFPWIPLLLSNVRSGGCQCWDRKAIP